MNDNEVGNYCVIHSKIHTFYIRKDLIDQIPKRALLNLRSDINTRVTMLYSDFVIDKQTNKFIKCRHDLTDILKIYLEHIKEV